MTQSMPKYNKTFYRMIQHESSIQNTESQGMSHLNYKHNEATIRLPFSQIGKVSRLVDFASEAKQTRTCIHNPTHRVIMNIHVASKKICFGSHFTVHQAIVCYNSHVINSSRTCLQYARRWAWPSYPMDIGPLLYYLENKINISHWT